MSSDTAAGRRGYFEDLYRKDPDPWRYQSRDYEIDKRAHTLSFLRPHYASACEVGCSIGVLTEDLAPRCDRLVGIDVSETAAALARARLADRPNVEILVRHLPHDDLPGDVDLLVLSEMLYFLTEAEIVDLAALAARRVRPGGQALIVSYDGETLTALDGAASTAVLMRSSEQAFRTLRAEQREHYHVRLLERRGDET